MSKNKEVEKDAVVPEMDIGETTETNGDAAAQCAEPEGEAEKMEYTLTAEEFEAAKEHIAKLQKERDETVSLLQRNQADFDNFRRRNSSIRTDSYEEGKRDCIKALLPVLDNFDRALANEEAPDDSWREGIRLACRQFYELLQKQGLEEVDVSGKFDPNLHEAVMRGTGEGSESGDILAVLQKGYRVGDKIIRHSMVKVAE